MTWLETKSDSPGRGQLAEQSPEVTTKYRVEPNGGFVEHQQLWVSEQRDRQRDAGPLTAGEAVHPVSLTSRPVPPVR